MKYTIKEIHPTQLKVEFEDESWAMVVIAPDATLEEIDNAVAQFDPDFRPKPEDLINTNVSIGEERTSRKIESSVPTFNFKNSGASSRIDVSPTRVTAQNSESNQIQPINTNFGIADVAEYFSVRGDNRLKNALNQKIQSYVSHENFSIDALVANYTNLPVHYPIAPDIDPQLDNSWEDIVKLAESELNAEQS